MNFFYYLFIFYLFKNKNVKQFFYNKQRKYKPVRATEQHLGWVVGAKIVRKMKEKQKYWEYLSPMF